MTVTPVTTSIRPSIMGTVHGPFGQITTQLSTFISMNTMSGCTWKRGPYTTARRAWAIITRI